MMICVGKRSVCACIVCAIAHARPCAWANRPQYNNLAPLLHVYLQATASGTGPASKAAKDTKKTARPSVKNRKQELSKEKRKTQAAKRKQQRIARKEVSSSKSRKTPKYYPKYDTFSWRSIVCMHCKRDCTCQRLRTGY